ncbi:hypothetical protein QQ045_024797 [Rhodiola kirilowii]
MAAAGVGKLFLASVLLVCFVGTCYGINLKDISNNTLIVTASLTNGSFLKAGVNNITVTWELSASAPAGNDSDWKTISLKLCYAPASQKDRAWRKTVDPISKDKTCQFKIASVAYGTQKTVTWIIQRNTPTAYYFIRAYVLNAAGHEVAYGQTTNYEKNTNIFFVEAVTGRHVSLDIASLVFSAFSVLSLVFFFWLEKSKGKRASKN